MENLSVGDTPNDRADRPNDHEQTKPPKISKCRPENAELVSILGVGYAHVLAFNNKTSPAEKFIPLEHGYPAAWTPSDIVTQPKGRDCTYLACVESRVCLDCGKREAHREALVIAVNGMCSRNHETDGTTKSGVGIFFGEDAAYNFKMRLPDTLHGSAMTDPKAELLAAARGLLHLYWLDKLGVLDASDTSLIVIKTGSHYVVEAMTEKMVKWKQNGWKTEQGDQVANVVLFKAIGMAVKMTEKQLGCKVLFWHVEREHNAEAAKLASEACGEELRKWA